ncbi:MAG: hypothetical protein KTR26_10260 [Flammeovirgaceae bacterium]|nr:hypothetical protein [Flammeovirgaceae bacterium]
MEQIFEILASMAGLIIYWLLTTRKNKQKKVKRRPEEVNPPERRIQREYEPMEEELPDLDYEAQEKKPEPEPEPYASFEEILQEFTQPKKRKIPTPEPEEVKMDFREEMEELKRKQREQEELAKQSLKKYSKGFSLGEDDDEHTNISTSPSSGRFDKFKIRKRSQAKIVEMLQDPEGIRNAFIAKEVFDRKYFDY